MANETILIIDDDPDILDLLDSILAADDYGICRAANGEEALACFGSQSVDLVITDLNMPGMGGLEVLSAVKRQDADMEVIVLTGNATVENAVQALRENGAFDYLTKPLDNIEDLLISVARAIERRNLTLQNRSLIKGLKNEVEERKRIEQQLLRSKTNLQSVFDGIPEPLIMLDRNMTVKVLNKAAKEYSRVARFQDVLGQACYTVFADREAPCDNCRLEEAILGNAPVTFERQGLKDSRRIEELVIYPMQYNGAGERNVILRIRDITEQREIERQLIRADRLSSLGQLSGGIAHEIRNPLASINLFTDILCDPQKYTRTPEEADLFEEIQENISRIDEIIKRVLDFAKPAATSSDAVDLNHLIQESVKFWTPQLRKCNIRLDLNLQDRLPSVQGDVIGLQQVIHNLVLNAIEALGEGGEIRIGTSRHRDSAGQGDTTVVMKISDTGPGIQSDHQEDIFNPFFTTKATGTGLGLSISHQIVKRQSGTFSFENNPHAGATFTIELPAAGTW
ncbi:MAG: response regulator [Desulfobacterales bacterium]|nr:response regulator [Desulfobacterales bacterium]